MIQPNTTVEKEVEAAYDYRGYVTVLLRSGEILEGFVYNREFANPLAGESNYIDLFVKSSGENRRCPISDIQSIALTGEDCAKN